MSDDAIFKAITAQRLRLVDRLETLNDTQWDGPTLCEGWAVRTVVGHLVWILETPLWRMFITIVAARGFDQAADKKAHEFGRRSPRQLVDAYRSLASDRFTPPGLGPVAPLTDILVHTRDIERPLGIASTLETGDLRIALDFLTSGKTQGFVAKGRLDGLRFEASDQEWSFGQGSLVRGTSEALMMAMTGRTVAFGDLAGDGASAFAARFTS